MVGDDDEDDLWLLQAVGALLDVNQKGVLRLIPATFPVPRLLNQQGNRFFDDIYKSDNPFLFRDHFRMDTRVYDSLYDACASFISRKIKYRREVLAVTLDWLGRAASCRDQEVKFGLAYSTALKYRHYGLYAIISALHDIIQLPTTVPMDFVGAFPHFDQALVAIDGVHVPLAVSAEDTERFRNRKGWISTNVLIASDWQLNVAYIYPGAEGAAHDSMVLARSELLQLIGDGMYVLADAGYALHPKVLTPFRGVRYHLKEFAEGSGRPRTEKELFNLRHAKARNVVERLNGCLKRRFKILRVPIECEFTVAKAVIFACACLHNFIRREASSDLAEDMGEAEDDDTVSAGSIETLSFDFSTARNWREWVADAMWTEYTEYVGSC